VMVYDRDGKFLRKIGSEKMFDRISSVTVDPGGERVYAVDIGGVNSENHRVRVFDGATGNHLFDIGKRGKGAGEFNLPRDLAVGRDAQLYVVDGGNFRVQVFDAAGRYLHAFGSIGKQLGNFARPKEVATDRDGNVYVVDTAFGNFQLFSPEGDLLMFIGERSEQDGPARYMLPSGVYVDEDGRLAARRGRVRGPAPGRKARRSGALMKLFHPANSYSACRRIPILGIRLGHGNARGRFP